MTDVNVIIGLDQRGSGFLLHGIIEGIIKRLERNFNCRVEAGNNVNDSKFINGVINVEIPIILKNTRTTTIYEIENVLVGLLDGYDKYSNLRVKIIE